MKKLYDWNIPLTINIKNTTKSLKIVCSVHTTIHQIKIEICKKMGLPVFDTEIQIYGAGGRGGRTGSASWMPMKSISSLQQNGITDTGGENIVAIVRRNLVNQKLDIQVLGDNSQLKMQKKLSSTFSSKFSSEASQSSAGLSLLAVCTNSACISHSLPILIQIGLLSQPTPFTSLIQSLKCQQCPYRSQFLRPTMMCKGMKLQNCTYRIEGKKSDQWGIPTFRKSQWKKIQGIKEIGQIGNGFDGDFCIVVKGL